MKTAAVSLLFVVFSTCLAHAGSFGGPPPFTNGSPLLTGVDGTYLGNIRDINTVGTVRFTYANNIQTSSFIENSYVIFSEGLVFGGPVSANITPTSITAVLGLSTDNAFGNTEMTGYFNADIDLNSAYASFSGKGLMQAFIQDDITLNYFTFFSKNFKIKGVRSSLNTSS